MSASRTEPAGDSRVAKHAPRICILAAKDLRRNTRVARQAESLRRDGWRVTVAALEPPPALNDAIEVLIVRVAHPLQRIDRPRKDSGAASGKPAAPARPSGRRMLVRLARAVALPFGHSITSLSFAHAAARTLAGRVFDVVQAHDAPALRAAARQARSCRAPLVYDAVEFVDSRPTFLTGRWARLLRRLESFAEARIVRRSSAVFSIGPSMSDWMQERYGIARPTVVRNCRELVAHPRGSTLRADTAIPANAKVVLYMNSVIPGRGLEQLLHAVALLEGAIHLAILGVAPQAEHGAEIDSLIEALGLRARVHFVPPVPANDVVMYASGADVGVIPFLNTSMNHYYALPNRLFEMIMARLPVAVSAFPDLSAVVDQHGVGATFDPTQPAEIARAISSLLDPQAGSALATRLERAASALSWEAESIVYCQALREVIAAWQPRLSRAPTRRRQ